MKEEPVEFQRLCKVIEALGYARITEIEVVDGVPVAVTALVRIELNKSVSARLRKLVLDREP